MKMLMIICPESRQEEVRALVGEHAIHAYSEIPGVLGEGETGKHLGTRTWPGRSSLIFTVLPKAKERDMVNALQAFKSKLYEGEGIRVFALPVESLM